MTCSAELAEWPDEAFAGFADCCESVEEHRRLLWHVCEQPERPLDDHGMFSHGCAACERAWKILGCPWPAELLPPVRR